MSKQKLGNSLVLALSELGDCDDCTYMETGSFELFGETEGGVDCSIEIDIAEMCMEAAERIEELENKLSESDESLRTIVEVCIDKLIDTKRREKDE